MRRNRTASTLSADSSTLLITVKVTQGSQSRYFMYDSLQRLIRARNPEQNTNASLALSDPLTGNSQWCMAYSYDANSNLTSKTDARGITTNYNYETRRETGRKLRMKEPYREGVATHSGRES